jgi:hypothetical protein
MGVLDAAPAVLRSDVVEEGPAGLAGRRKVGHVVNAAGT